MSSGGPGVIGVATGGIQDVSALLPLLGTEQCESLVTSALQEGLLYAAATPMSIFGSLGVAKAGFVVLWTSIDTAHFPGPKLLRNAGFVASGVGSLLSHVAESSHHLYNAEDKIRRVLARKRIRSVKVNILSKDLFLWNLRLVIITVLLSTLGLLPYVFLIVHFLPDQPFQATWLYPIIRIVGCDIIAINIQFIFQIRILEETYHRIRFMATDDCLKDHGKSLPPFWDANERSKTILHQLKSYLSQSPDQTPARYSVFKFKKASAPSPNPVEVLTSPLSDTMKQNITSGLGKISSFSFPVFGEGDPLPPGLAPSGSHTSAPDFDTAEKGALVTDEEEPPQPQRRHLSPDWLARYLTSFLLFASQITLLFGLVLAVVGYIGCFSVVQAAPRPDSKGPLVWLVCEALLAVLRTFVWAWNPAWDDPRSPIALEKVLSTPPKKASAKNRSSYGIGWMLDSATADDMHALIIGINEYNSSRFPALEAAVPDAIRITNYLKDVLLVPPNQIVSLYDKEATEERIVAELRALADNGSVKEGAPIMIYFATHGFEVKDRVYLLPYQSSMVPSVSTVVSESDEDEFDEMKSLNSALSYDTIVDLLGRIAREKSDNVTLVLDTCNAGSMGKNEKFDKVNEGHTEEVGISPGLLIGEASEILVGHSSHILVAATGPGSEAYEEKGGGLFTRCLIGVLQNSNILDRMTYRMLVDQINEKVSEKKHPHQRAVCTSIYQNRLLFNGLFSRMIADDGATPVITVQYSDE